MSNTRKKTMTITRTKITKQTVMVAITKEKIIELLGDRLDITVPKDAEVFVRIPGGGDYSNTNLDLGTNTPLYIQWVEDINE